MAGLSTATGLFLYYTRRGLSKGRHISITTTVALETWFLERELDNIRGIAWDGSALWMIDVHGNLVRCDTSGRRLRRLAVPVQGWPVDLEWVGGELWVADVHGQVTRFDSAFVKIGSFSLADCGAGPFPYEVATYWDGESLWLADTNQSRILQCGPAD